MGRHLPLLLDVAHNAVRQVLSRHCAPPALCAETPRAPSLPDTPAPCALVDGTCGNGRDTLFLAQTLRDAPSLSHIPLLSFDIQAEALANAKQLLADHALAGYATFIHQGHERIAAHVPQGAGILVAMYNLGFLPGSDKTVVTQAHTSIASFDAVAGLMPAGGLLSVHAYGGHAGGLEELAATDAWFRALPSRNWRVLRHEICNKPRNPEVLYLAERLAKNAV